MAPEKPRLLIVDDSATIRNTLSRFLESKGFRIVAADNGETALDLLQRESFDVVLLDVVMPGLDGLAVLKKIRMQASKLELPVLMATARTDSSDVVDALKAGANDYVTKPIDLPVALARIESQLVLREQLTSMQARQAILEPDGSVPVGTVLDARYELLEKLGAGGFAVVYKARQSSTGQLVAVKLLRAHRAATPGTADVELARFRREMSLIGQLHHPHIVRLIDSGWLEVKSNPARVVRSSAPPTAGPPTSPTIAVKPLPVADLPTRDAGVVDARLSSTLPPDEVETRIPFIVMEYLEGESLYERLARDGRLPVEETIDLLLPVMSALWAAHARDAVHRDLKPGNIFLALGDQERVRPTVLDFGVAKLKSDDAAELTTGSTVGTPGYWSPEQAMGKLDIDARSDQYTLGAIVYQCVCGRRAFDGGGMAEIHRIAKGDFEKPSTFVKDLPPGFEAAVLRAMATDRDERYPSMRAMARAFLPFASSRARSVWAPMFEEGGTVPPPRSDG